MDRKEADKIAEEFCKKFCYNNAVGTIGRKKNPVTLVGVSLSSDCVTERTREYGCPPGKMAILVDFVPAGMEYDRGSRDASPKEIGINPKKIPPRKTWVKFPAKFMNLAVYYKRGEMAFAQC
jgi:hypothetical protein